MLTPQLKILIVLFVISVVIWFILIVYKKRLEREEEDKVFLGSTPERLNEEQTKLLEKVNRLSKPMWIVGSVTVLLLLSAVGVWIYQGLLRN
jgi:hypothetical protein